MHVNLVQRRYLRESVVKGPQKLVLQGCLLIQRRTCSTAGVQLPGHSHCSFPAVFLNTNICSCGLHSMSLLGHLLVLTFLYHFPVGKGN